ncbi:MAG: matrixin family metalloprotease [bacterium]
MKAISSLALVVGATALLGTNVHAFEFFDPVVSWPAPTSTINADIRKGGVNPNSPSGTSWDDAFSDAATEWTTNTPFNLNVNTAVGSHPCAGYPGYPAEDSLNGADFTDEVCDEPYGGSTLAVTITYFIPETGEIVESDIMFKESLSWDVYDGALQGSQDFQRVALHEQGHFQGLGHSNASPAIMQANVSATDSLQADDIAGIVALYGAEPGLDPIVMAIESPFAGEVKAGVSTFRGWVVSQVPLTQLKYYENNVFKSDLQTGGARSDIGVAYPDYPGSGTAGFAFAQNWAKLGPGNHTVRVDARDTQGNTLSKSVSFSVEKFDTNFVQDNQVSMGAASVSKVGSDVVINNFQHAGQTYKVTLRWKKQGQTFEILDITKQ